MPKSTKRTFTRPPRCLSTSSSKYSRPTITSSLLSPCSRRRKRYGTSPMRSPGPAESTMSSRILKPMPESRCANRSKVDTRTMKNPLMGSLSSCSAPIRLSRLPSWLSFTRQLGKFAHAAAGDVARAHHQVEIFFAHAAQHLRQNAFVVLHVGIHHRDKRRRRAQNSLDARRGQPAPPDPLQHAQIVVLLRPAAAPRPRCRRASRRPQKSLRSECPRAPSPADRQSGPHFRSH